MNAREQLNVIALGLALSLTLSAGTARADMIGNGNFDAAPDFSDGSGWESSDDFSTLPSSYVSRENGRAVLRTSGTTDGPFLVTLFQDVAFSSQAAALKFDLKFDQVDDQTTGSGFGDFFQVSFVGTNFQQTAFIGVDAAGPYDPQTFLPRADTADSLGWYHFSFDVTSLRDISGTLYFDLKDYKDGKLTTITLDDVIVTETAPVPEPAAMLLFGTGLAGLAGVCRWKKQTPWRAAFPANGGEEGRE